ncbi:MAG: hypothetical protein PHG85_04020 [Candidatus Altiarchaeota archaeon]|nr:hypothetical protein [Candidatus Altiarchaeota archaeon]
MEVGIVVLGILILFGATILFKAAGFTEPSREAAPERPEQKPQEQLAAPPQSASRAREPQEALGRTALPDPDKRAHICKNCMADNQEDAEFCVKCGKKMAVKEPEIFQLKKKWFKQNGWIKNPFSLDVIPSLFTGYKDEVDLIMKTLSMQSGHILIIGGMGNGKTTMLKWLELNVPSDYKPLYIFRPPEHFDDIIDLMVYSIEGSIEKRKYNIYNIDRVIRSVNKKFILLLDEAHEFKAEITEPLKTLGDIEGVTMVMASLPDGEEEFKNHSKPLYDRIVGRVNLNGLNEGEVSDMIVKRIENCGGFGHKPFTENALKKVYQLSKGNPRTVMKICDQAVKMAIENNSDKIDEAFINPADLPR